MSYSIIKVEGIGAVYTKKLAKVGIKTTGALLKRVVTPADRKELAKLTGIGDKLILEFANLADLMRIKGVAEEWADLLEEAGVDTVKELKGRKPENLHMKMVQVNDKKKLVRRVPPLGYVKDWVKQAKKLKPILKY
jgi:predicted flap endonuclease-1-like 5' DNA nuclease